MHSLLCHIYIVLDAAIRINSTITIFVIIIINPLTAKIIRILQLPFQPAFFLSICPSFHCPLGLAELHTCPFPNVVFPLLPGSTIKST